MSDQVETGYSTRHPNPRKFDVHDVGRLVAFFETPDDEPLHLYSNDDALDNDGIDEARVKASVLAQECNWIRISLFVVVDVRDDALELRYVESGRRGVDSRSWAWGERIFYVL